MPQGGPDVLVNSTYYDRALNSSDWGNTPDGLVYKSCIYQIPSGAEVDSTHNEIIEASGATLPAPPCPYSRLLKPSAAAATKQSGTATPAAVNPGDTEWLIYAQYVTSSPLNYMATGYAVPYPPTSPGATDYLFSSFRNSTDNSILQPVIGFGPTTGEDNRQIGGNYQWMASYYVWGSNVAVGDLIQVSTNNTIHGYMSAANCGSGGGDCTWTILTQDNSAGTESQLVVSSSPAYTVFDGAVLESTGGGCNKLFSNAHGVFRGLLGITNAGALTPSWSVYPSQPQCSAYMTGDSANLDIFWTP
jgi:hypothetical protein